MSYENSPATKMLATHCAICARPLVDAKSVEIGIGPDCRKKYGYDAPISEEARLEANKVVYKIACDQDGPEVLTGCERLAELGLPNVVAAVLNRVAKVKIVQLEDGCFAVKAPYSEEAVGIMRNVPGRRWDAEKKLNTFPQTSKGDLFYAIQRAYAGMLALGPKGAFKIPSAGEPAPYRCKAGQKIGLVVAA